ncbi:MAG: hypothetical protein WA880_01740 [Ornithinimicrobium sp.]
MKYAVRRLRPVGASLVDLDDDYEAAWQEWEATDDWALWDATSVDGVSDASR